LGARAQGADAAENRVDPKWCTPSAASGWADRDDEACQRSAGRGVSRVALLDVNLLIALFDSEHVHHDVAHDWFADHRANRWATCSITENGLVRVLSTPSYHGGAVRSADALERLRIFSDSDDHTFWDRTVSLRDGRIFYAPALSGYRQLTDIYLL